MPTETHIAAAIFQETPALKFEDIVSEFELSLRANATGRLSMTFDHDDLVIVEIDQMRVGLAWVSPSEPFQPHSLIVATGFAPDHPASPDAVAYCTQLGETILAHTYDDMPYDTVFRASFDHALNADFLDQIAGGLAELISFEAPTEQNCYQTEPPALAAIHAPEPAQASVGAATGFQRLREVYQQAMHGDSAQTSVIWQAMMLGANTMLETATHGADFVRQVKAANDDPFVRLKKMPSAKPMARYFGGFDKAEYDLYGSLLD